MSPRSAGIQLLEHASHNFISREAHEDSAKHLPASNPILPTPQCFDTAPCELVIHQQELLGPSADKPLFVSAFHVCSNFPCLRSSQIMDYPGRRGEEVPFESCREWPNTIHLPHAINLTCQFYMITTSGGMNSDVACSPNPAILKSTNHVYKFKLILSSQDLQAEHITMRVIDCINYCYLMEGGPAHRLIKVLRPLSADQG